MRVISMFKMYTNEFLFFDKIYQNFSDLMVKLTELNKDNIKLMNEVNLFKEKSMCHVISFLVKNRLPISDNEFYKTLSDNIMKNIINNLDNMLKGKRNFNDIFQISIVECEKKLDKYYPGVISKIFDNQLINSKQYNTNSVMSLENEICMLKNTNLGTKLSQPNNQNLIKIINSGEINSLSFNSERDDTDKKELPKITSVAQIQSNIIKDIILGSESMHKSNNDDNPIRKKSNSGTHLEKIITPLRLDINKNGTSSNLVVLKNKVEQEENKQGLKQNIIKASFKEELSANSKKNMMDNKKRKDMNGTPIIKGSKRHKLTFRDQRGMKFIFQVQVESYKEYNLLNKHNEDIYSEQSSKMTCCALI